MLRIIAVLFVFFINLISSNGQGIETAGHETVVSLSASAESKEVPLNRTIGFTVRASWEDDLDQLEITQVDEPMLSNFEIIGTASANRVSGTPEGGKKSIREIVYTLRPKTLGMGYIETVGLTYADKRTGSTHRLKTERIGIEVTSPVAEPGKRKMGWIWLLILLLVGSGGMLSILFLKRKKTRLETKIHEVKPILEDVYLQELKGTIDLKSGNRRDDFAILSRLFKKYILEKYSIPDVGSTTDELVQTMKAQSLDEGLIRKSESLFKKADVIKFSGQDTSQAEIEEAYTIVEAVLESNGAAEKEKRRQMEEGETKRRKKFGKIFKPLDKSS